MTQERSSAKRGRIRWPLATRLGWIAAPLALAFSPSLAGAGNDTPAARVRMVEEEVIAAGITNPRVVAAMRATPRDEFVPPAQRDKAFFDMALSIGEGQ